MEDKKVRHNFAILNRFNCFALSHTKTHTVESDVEDRTSRKEKTKGGWKTMPYIIGHESCERLAGVGLASNMVVYLRTKYNMEIVAIANMFTIWSGTTHLSTLGGAYLADSYIGRYLAIVIGGFSVLISMTFWTLTARVRALRPAQCSDAQAKLRECKSASKEQMAFLQITLLFMNIGSALIRPSATPFGADQFERGGTKDLQQMKSLQSFFNWYYFFNIVIVLVGSTVIVYLQTNVSWSLGFGVCTVLMAISMVAFLVGTPTFYREQPQGSPFTGVVQVIVASIKKRNLSLPSDPALLYSDQTSPKITVTTKFRFLNKAAIVTEGDMQADGSIARPWRLSPIHKVQELKILIALLPFFSIKIINVISGGQQGTYVVIQALTMNRRLGNTSFIVPAASIDTVSLIVGILWIPIYDRVFVPLTRRLTKNEKGITSLQRMGIGYVISLLASVVAALVEVKRRNVAKSHGLTDDPSAIVPISAFWLVPQFCIDGLASCFHAVGSLDFFYSQFPPNFRSTAIAVSAIMYAVGDYLSALLTTLIHRNTDWLDSNINRGRLDYYYWLVSGMDGFVLLYFLLVASLYKYRVNPVSDGSETSDMSDGQEMESKQIEIEQELDHKLPHSEGGP